MQIGDVYAKGGIALKLKEGFLLKTVAGSKIVVPVGEASVSFNGVITLSGSAAYLWEKLQSGATEEEFREFICKKTGKEFIRV